MARGKKANSGKTDSKSNGFGGYSFINVSLSVADKERMAATELADEYSFARVHTLVEEGYKFSLKYDDRNNTFVASLTDVSEGSPTYKHILTGRGSTSLNAWYAVAHRHYYILSDGWESAKPTEAASDFD